MGSSSSTTRSWTGPPAVISATQGSFVGSPKENGAARSVWIGPRSVVRRDERDLDRGREQARAVRACQQLAHRAAAGGAVVDGVRVHVHPDEAVRAVGIEAATVPPRVRERVAAVRQAVLDTGL